MYKRLSGPLLAHIEITSKCPNRCSHCFNYWRRQKDSSDNSCALSMSQIDRIVDELIRMKVFHVVLTGGEPLSNKQVLFHGIGSISEKSSMNLSMNSTLIGITKEDARHLREANVAVLTTLLGSNASIHDLLCGRHGAFDDTVTGIKLLVAEKVHLEVNMVVTIQNIYDLRNTGDLALSLGVHSFAATRVQCPVDISVSDFSKYSLDDASFALYLEKYIGFCAEKGLNEPYVLESYPLCGTSPTSASTVFSGRGCLAGVASIAVSPYGVVRSCTHMSEGYGNILTEDLSSIWDRMAPLSAGEMLPEGCRMCDVLPWCGGGCRAEAQAVGGKSNAFDPYAKPDFAKDVASLIRSRKVNIPSAPQQFRVNPYLRWRIENFGSVVFADYKLAGYLNNDATDFILSLDKSITYSREDFTVLSPDFDLDKFLAMLYARRMILPATSDNT